MVIGLLKTDRKVVQWVKSARAPVWLRVGWGDRLPEACRKIIKWIVSACDSPRGGGWACLLMIVAALHAPLLLLDALVVSRLGREGCAMLSALHVCTGGLSRTSFCCAWHGALFTRGALLEAFAMLGGGVWAWSRPVLRTVRH